MELWSYGVMELWSYFDWLILSSDSTVSCKWLSTDEPRANPCTSKSQEDSRVK